MNGSKEINFNSLKESVFSSEKSTYSDIKILFEMAKEFDDIDVIEDLYNKLNLEEAKIYLESINNNKSTNNDIYSDNEFLHKLYIEHASDNIPLIKKPTNFNSFNGAPATKLPNNIAQLIQDIFIKVDKKIENNIVAKQFVLEELDGAYKGNKTSKKFASTSGIPKKDFVGQMSDSYYEVDGKDGPQQIFIREVLPFWSDENKDKIVEIKISVLKKIMKKYGLGKYKPKTFKNKRIYLKASDIDLFKEYLIYHDHHTGDHTSYDRVAKNKYYNKKMKSYITINQFSIIKQVHNSKRKSFLKIVRSSIKGENKNYQSIFISYSTQDEAFATQLYKELKKRGINIWYAPHNMQGGKTISHQVKDAIRKQERVILILSKHSMQSNWVATEIMHAISISGKEKKLFPVRVINYEKIKKWELFDSDSGTDLARKIREFFIPDFEQWSNNKLFLESVKKLANDLTIN